MILTVPIDAELYPTLGDQVCDFIEQNLVFGPGDLRGRPAVLDDEKRALVYRMYEVHPRSHPQAGRRRFKRCAISLRKGTAKTELAAWIAACELHPDGPVRCTGWTKDGDPIGGPVTDPYIPMVAYTEEQSEDLAFGALRVILELSTLKDDFDIGLERILRRKGDGKAVPLATAPDSRDGARTTWQHFDEPLALDTLVPTPFGWRTIGEIKPGEHVYGRSGQAIRVVGASEVKTGRPCYRVTFDNGESVVTDGAHRWTAVEWSNRAGGERQVSTEQMLAAGVRTAYGWRWRLPRAAGFDGAHVDSLPVDPYLLGLWLGDGSSDAGYINSGAVDYPVLCFGIEHSVSNDARPLVRWLPTGLRSRLRRAGILGRKHIPSPYLFASRQQRLELLRGLMDTDGYTTSGGNCTFVQKHREMCDQVAFLVRTLGANATVREYADPRSRTGAMFKVHFSPSFCPFRLPRKAAASTWGERISTSWPTVVSIEPVESVPVRCIAVDSDDHLFLVGRGLHLTHNTHRLTLPRLVRAHQTMLGNIPKRYLADAWTLETTTAPEPGAGSIAEGAMEYAAAVKDGRIRDASLFYFHRQAGDQHDMTTPEGARAAVIEASGPAVSWSDIDGIMSLWADPTFDRTYFERVYANRLVRSSTQAFNVEAWKNLEQPETEIAGGRLITIGFDGAQFHDSTGLVCTDVETGYQWVAGIWECPPGADKRVENPWQVPAEEVDAKVRELFATYAVWRMYADPPYWQSWIATWRGLFGDDRVIEWWTNRRTQMTRALEAFDTSIKEGSIRHDGDTRYRRHIGNARRHDLSMRDENGKALWLIAKDRPQSPHKIDLAMAGVLSWEARMDAIAANALADHQPEYQMIFVGGGRPAVVAGHPMVSTISAAGGGR